MNILFSSSCSHPPISFKPRKQLRVAKKKEKTRSVPRMYSKILSGLISILSALFLSAAKPSDLGTLGVVLLLVVEGHFWNLSMCSFSELCSKVARFFNIFSKLKKHFAEVRSRVARFYRPTSQAIFPEVCSKRCVLNTPLAMLLGK